MHEAQCMGLYIYLNADSKLLPVVIIPLTLLALSIPQKVLDSMGTLRPQESIIRQHLRDSSGVTLSVVTEDGKANIDKGGTDALPRIEVPPWESDPRGYYTTFYSQFGNIIMISTFTGGVQAAVLSFMNDLLAGEPINAKLFYPDPLDTGRTVYSAYSLGLMLGLLAVALNLTVAAIAAVNAALACHFSIHVPPSKPSMEARIVFCMLIQFMASGVSGISLILLCIEFDLAFTIVTAILFFSGILISAYHLISLFGAKWFTELKGQPLHSISLVLSTVAFCFDVVTPSPASWFTISTYGITVTYHMMAVLHNRSTHGQRPRRLATFAVMVIAAMWAGCVAVTSTLRYHRHEGKNDMHEEVVRYVIASLAGLEALVLLAIGVRYCFAVVKWTSTAHSEDGAPPQ